MPSPRERADKLVVEAGLAESRQKAQAMILAGQIVADDHVVKKSPAKRITKARIGSGTRTRGSGTRTTTFSPEVTYSNPYVNMWASFWGTK